jgi:hypothetical protein
MLFSLLLRSLMGSAGSTLQTEEHFESVVRMVRKWLAEKGRGEEGDEIRIWGSEPKEGVTGGL